jgi:ribonuclease HII
MTDYLYSFDNTYKKHENDLIGGIDEAGRGPLAGPVVAACVVLSSKKIDGLNDSKKLTKRQRIELEKVIKETSLDWSIAFCPPKLIDHINILEATKVAMVLAYQGLTIKPDTVLIDAVNIPFFPIMHHEIIKGDSKSASIAAASILAKQARDRYMEKLHSQYPQYDFYNNKGYPTKIHFEALKIHGPCKEHRFSFRGVS